MPTAGLALATVGPLASKSPRTPAPDGWRGVSGGRRTQGWSSSPPDWAASIVRGRRQVCQATSDRPRLGYDRVRSTDRAATSPHDRHRGSPMPTDDPAFSITVSTIAGWDEIRKAVGASEAAAGRVGGEVVVMDGSLQPAPPPDELSPVTSWH